jgi:hypothetical protein
VAVFERPSAAHPAGLFFYGFVVDSVTGAAAVP